MDDLGVSSRYERRVRQLALKANYGLASCHAEEEASRIAARLAFLRHPLLRTKKRGLMPYWPKESPAAGPGLSERWKIDPLWA